MRPFTTVFLVLLAAAPLRALADTHEFNVTEGRFDALTAKGGYGYTMAFTPKIFLASALQVGFGVMNMKVKGTDFSTSRSQQASKIDAIISTGYSGDDYYGGFRATGDATGFNTGNMEITSTLWAVSLYFGLRI